MTSIITFVQITAVSTAAILVGICLVCSRKKSTPLKRHGSRPVVGNLASELKANRQSIHVPDAVLAPFPPGVGKDEADFIFASPPF